MKQQAQPLEPITDFWKSGISVWQQLGQTNQQLWQDFAKQQVDFATLCADYGRREMELCVSGKSPTDLFSAQSQLATEFAGKLMDLSRAAASMITRAEEEWMSAVGRSQPLSFTQEKH
ncbi:MAG: phasin family protein [Acidobacteria bacterium]|nr:phasin family protein [Acidobacteriota bacterium]